MAAHFSLLATASLNANDWLNNYSNVKQPQDKYYYPGATIGGPIVIPGTRFHKDNTKLFFWTGFEYYYQVLDTGLLRQLCRLPANWAATFHPSQSRRKEPRPLPVILPDNSRTPPLPSSVAQRN